MLERFFGGTGNATAETPKAPRQTPRREKRVLTTDFADCTDSERLDFNRV
jgi:hypothetical protein